MDRGLNRLAVLIMASYSDWPSTRSSRATQPTSAITLVPTTGILLVHYHLLEGGMDVDALFEIDGTY